jgi:hypothetical protein
MIPRFEIEHILKSCRSGKWDDVKNTINFYKDHLSDDHLHEILNESVPVNKNIYGKLDMLSHIMNIYDTPDTTVHLFYLAVKYLDKNIFNLVINEGNHLPMLYDHQYQKHLRYS